MGDKKGKKDRTKEQRQAKAKESKIETQKRDRQQQRIPGATGFAAGVPGTVKKS